VKRKQCTSLADVPLSAGETTCFTDVNLDEFLDDGILDVILLYFEELGGATTVSVKLGDVLGTAVNCIASLRGGRGGGRGGRERGGGEREREREKKNILTVWRMNEPNFMRGEGGGRGGGTVKEKIRHTLKEEGGGGRL
jgi:hypothetical protein